MDRDKRKLMQRSGFLAKPPRTFKVLTIAMIALGSWLLAALLAVAAFRLYIDTALYLIVGAGLAFTFAALFKALDDYQRQKLAAERLRELSTMQRGVGGYVNDQLRDAGRGHLTSL